MPQLHLLCSDGKHTSRGGGGGGGVEEEEEEGHRGTGVRRREDTHIVDESVIESLD